MTVRIQSTADGVVFGVKVVPGASRTRLAGTWGERVKIAVSAPAEAGRANRTLTRFLADLLGVRIRDVSIVTGDVNPLKTVRVTGCTVDQIRAVLSPETT